MIVDAIPGLKALLDRFERWGRDRRELRDAALAAILEAATETKLYLERLSAGGRRSRDEEIGLVRLWRKAAVPERHLDRDLADRCLRKSEHWISPEKWNRQRREELRIGIDDVFETARSLFNR